jgi:hypothetical protein
MFHVKPRQIQPGASVPRRTDDAPGVRPIGQHFRRVARHTAAARAASRPVAHLAVQSVAGPTRRARYPATLDRALLARTPQARALPRTARARTAQARTAPAKAVLAAAVLAAARSPGALKARVPDPRVSAAAGPDDADRPVTTTAQPFAPCQWGQNLFPRRLAVQFLVGRYYSPARYPAARSSLAQNSAARRRVAAGPASGYLAIRRPGSCPTARLPAWLSAGGASTPASTARIRAAARSRPDQSVPEAHTTAAPGPRSRAQAASTRTALARRALSQTGPLRAAASGLELGSRTGRPSEAGQQLPRTAPHQTEASAATTMS